MSEISIGLTWKLGDGKMTPDNYSNVHEITFTPKIKIIADSAPDWRGNEINSNPEQTGSFIKQLSYDDFFSFSSKNEVASN